MIHEIVPVGPLQVNCSILGCVQNKEAVVVDPGGDPERILEAVKRLGLTVKYIALTHAHIDHIGAVAEIKEATGASVLLCPDDTQVHATVSRYAGWLGIAEPKPFTVDAPLTDGGVLRIGTLELRVIQTPGHTPGGVCFYIEGENTLIAGDTLFQGSVGRSDLPGGDSDALMRSIRERLLPLPDETKVFPGHGDSTTIGRERRNNPFLRG